MSPRKWRRAPRPDPSQALHPAEVPTLPAPDESAPDQPFAEGIADVLSPDLRHRLISEAAFHHLAERGFENGNEVDDWSEAQAEVEHTLVHGLDEEPSYR